MTTKLRPYQIEGAKAIRKFNGNALLADEMGLGKTLQVLYYCYKMKRMRPVVVVCPASLKYNWQREAQVHLGMTARVLSGTKPMKGKPVDEHPFIVINYDILKDWTQWIIDMEPECLVLDECQRIKNMDTLRYEAVAEIGQYVRRIIGISGTPIKNRAFEFFPILNLIRPDKFPSITKYAFRYCNPTRNRFSGRWEFKGSKNLPELHGKLNKYCMIRRLKKDVLKDLPEKQRVVLPLILKQMNKYEKAKNDFKRWARSEGMTPKKRGLMLAKFAALRGLVAELKLPECLDWIDNFLEETGEKIVLFAHHRKIIDKVMKHYGKRAVKVDGSVKDIKREQAVNQFQNNPKIDVFIGQIQAAGEGLTLTAASTALFLEMADTPSDHSQCEDRIHRIGQTKKASIYYLIAHGTVEESMAKMVEEKQATVDEILDGKAQESSFDVFSQVIQKML